MYLEKLCKTIMQLTVMVDAGDGTNAEKTGCTMSKNVCVYIYK